MTDTDSQSGITIDIRIAPPPPEPLLGPDGLPLYPSGMRTWPFRLRRAGEVRRSRRGGPSS